MCTHSLFMCALYACLYHAASGCILHICYGQTCNDLCGIFAMDQCILADCLCGASLWRNISYHWSSDNYICIHSTDWQNCAHSREFVDNIETYETDFVMESYWWTDVNIVTRQILGIIHIVDGINAKWWASKVIFCKGFGCYLKCLRFYV